MGGVRFAYKLGGVTGNSSALRDDYFGVRGGASPADLSGFLIAVGPAFKSGTVIDTPSGVVDIAPTLLYLLEPGLESKLGEIDGRPLIEAFVDGGEAPSSEPVEKVSASATLLTFFSPTEADSNATTRLTAAGTYSSRLEGYSFDGGETLAYFTLAGANRQGLTCETFADCPEGVSCGAKGVCLITPTCVDGVKNGAETDIDCGFGAQCRPCYVGQACVNASDCESARCVDNVCQMP